MCRAGLKFLVRICTDLGLKEAADYSIELKKAEKSKEMRDERMKGKPGSEYNKRSISQRCGTRCRRRTESHRSAVGLCVFRFNSPDVLRR